MLHWAVSSCHSQSFPNSYSWHTPPPLRFSLDNLWHIAQSHQQGASVCFWPPLCRAFSSPDFPVGDLRRWHLFWTILCGVSFAHLDSQHRFWYVGWQRYSRSLPVTFSSRFLEGWLFHSDFYNWRFSDFRTSWGDLGIFAPLANVHPIRATVSLTAHAAAPSTACPSSFAPSSNYPSHCS